VGRLRAMHTEMGVYWPWQGCGTCGARRGSRSPNAVDGPVLAPSGLVWTTFLASAPSLRISSTTWLDGGCFMY
jgi:hypothetical protein